MSFEGATHDQEKLQLDIFNVVEKKLKSKFDALGDDFRLYTQWLYLNTIDQLWKDHLLQMDHLRQGIHLRGYGQKDPKIEYKKEGFELFQIMKGRIAASTISMVMRVEPVQQQVATPQPAQAGARHRATTAAAAPAADGRVARGVARRLGRAGRDRAEPDRADRARRTARGTKRSLPVRSGRSTRSAICRSRRAERPPRTESPVSTRSGTSSTSNTKSNRLNQLHPREGPTTKCASTIQPARLAASGAGTTAGADPA